MSTISVADIASAFSDGDRRLIERAYDTARELHEGQMRRSGEPYITHPLAVAGYLADLGFDAPSVAAALLHDVVEDCGVTTADLARMFGTDVAFLVDGVTKLKHITFRGTAKDRKMADLQTESLKKMFFAMAEDVRVIIIKLADRLHNMRTLHYKDAPSRNRIALETLEMYAPIADRLGMGRMRGELEDLAFPYAYPHDFAWLKGIVKDQYEDRLQYIERTGHVVRRHLTTAGIEVVDIHARAKRMWSLYRKLARYDMDPDKVMDLVALRIVVGDIKACYGALGIIHAHYKPLPGRIKDYIALPKPNGYRSLHTTVFCEKGRVAEIQIRTAQMHDHAENGVAAHWGYTDAGKRAVVAKQSELEWINQLKVVLKGIKTSAGMADLKIDFFKNRIFALTPHGDVKDLPEGATPVDFAYAVHSELGHRTVGAFVNDKLESLDHVLQSGDVVQLQKGKEARPSKDWLRFVKTTLAAKQITAWFKRKDPAMSLIPPTSRARKQPAKGIPRLTRDVRQTAGSTVTIDGQQGLAYKIGRCCSPLTGTPVVGYLTLSRGVTVHAPDCINIRAADRRRLLTADWALQKRLAR